MHKAISLLFVLNFCALFILGCFLVSLVIKKDSRDLSLAFLLCGLLLCASGVRCWYHPAILVLPKWFVLGWLPLDLRCDTLSSFFIVLLGIVCTSCALFSTDYVSHMKDRINFRLYWSCLFLFLSGMLTVLLAGNAVTFLVGWEVMSLTSFVLVACEYNKHQAQNSAFIYMVATRIASMFLAAGFLLMSVKCESIAFSSWNFSESSSWIPAVLILLGLIIKSGIWPFHIWLPYAHAEAPSPISALMSGIMVKLPVYAAFRFFIFGHLSCTWLPYTLLVFSAITAFWGILFALNQRELKRLLAYSTVENIGLIYISFSLMLIAQAEGLPLIRQMAMIATLLQVAFHALFKPLLFLCAGSIDFAVNTKDMSRLGGIGKKMPITFATFVVGSAAICALPPLNGFASKWCIYQTLLQCSFGLHEHLGRAVSLALIGLLGTIGALAIATFVKAIGVVFLGNSRAAQLSNVREAPLSMWLPQVGLAAACLLSSLNAPILVRLIEPVSVQAGWGHFDFDLFQPLPLRLLGVVLPVLVVAIYLTVFRRKAKVFRTWDCGFGTPPVRSQVSADSFAQPIARIFTPVLQYHLSVDISGADRRHFPEKIVVEPSMVSLLETRLYQPLGWSLNKLSQLVAKLQTGSIHLYLLYVCLALIILLVIGAWL
jgi:hydrogenase-4 component B